MTTLTDYISIGTGFIGMVTGCLGYLKSSQMKSLDLRLELRKSLASAHHELSLARGCIELAAESRRRVMAATGHGRSGNMIAWNRSVETDTATLNGIAPTIRSEEAEFSELNDKQLESEIVATHSAIEALSTLRMKYQETYKEDEERRREIRQEMAKRTNQMMAANRRDT